MNSKRSHEGWLMIDHRAARGTTREMLPRGGVAVADGKMAEMPTKTCRHCQKAIIVNPMRNREREYCPKCDHYICDECGLIRRLNGGECHDFERFADGYLNMIAKGGVPDLSHTRFQEPVVNGQG